MKKNENRRDIGVGPGMSQIIPVAYWYREGHFKNDDEARGAFRLAYLQGLDGAGKSIHEWMGLMDEEYNQWMRDDSLPKI